MENQPQELNQRVLPRKISELLELGLKSLNECESDPNYQIDFQNWHLGDDLPGEPCKVCLAGSIMAKVLKVEIDTNLSPRDLVFNKDLSYDDCDALEALNDLRCGSVCMAAQVLGEDYSQNQKAWMLMNGNRNITPYAVDKNMFKNEMNVLVEELKEMGL